MTIVADTDPKLIRFAEEYLLDFSPTGAARRAGYANPQDGHTLLLNERVDALIAEGKRRATNRVNISVDLLLEQLRSIAVATPYDALSDDLDELKAPGSMTDAQKAAVKSIKWTKEGPSVTMHDKIAAIDKLGKYLGIWSDKADTTVNVSLPTINSTDTPQEAAEKWQDAINAS